MGSHALSSKSGAAQIGLSPVWNCHGPFMGAAPLSRPGSRSADEGAAAAEDTMSRLTRKTASFGMEFRKGAESRADDGKLSARCTERALTRRGRKARISGMQTPLENL